MSGPICDPWRFETTLPNQQRDCITRNEEDENKDLRHPTILCLSLRNALALVLVPVQVLDSMRLVTEVSLLPPLLAEAEVETV